jgi:2-keto-4-pentenoate hydratase
MTTVEGLPPALRPSSFEEAYAIQDEMAALIGQKTVGWKIGPASPGLMRAEGFDEPAAGRVFEPNVYRSPAELPNGCITDAKLEPEFAVRLNADVAPRDKAYTAEELAPLAVLCLAFEVSGCRFSTPRAVAKASSRTSDMPSPLDLLADNGSGGALVVGDVIPQWQELDLHTLQVDLRIDGGPPAANFEGDDRSNPLDVLLWLANFLSRRGIGLRAGDLVATGSTTHEQPLYAGASATAVFGDLGELHLTMI